MAKPLSGHLEGENRKAIGVALHRLLGTARNLQEGGSIERAAMAMSKDLDKLHTLGWDNYDMNVKTVGGMVCALAELHGVSFEVLFTKIIASMKEETP